MLYRFVDARRAEGFSVRTVCSVVGVSPSAYYAYRERPEDSPAQLAEAALVNEIRAIWAESGGTYGSPRVCAELRRRGRVVNHKRVERLMKRHDMTGNSTSTRGELQISHTPSYLHTFKTAREEGRLDSWQLG